MKHDGQSQIPVLLLVLSNHRYTLLYRITCGTRCFRTIGSRVIRKVTQYVANGIDVMKIVADERVRSPFDLLSTFSKKTLVTCLCG